MWTLAQARSRLTGRLGEVSTAFWSNQDRNDAINDAQRLVSAVTLGVPLTTTGTVNSTTPSVDIEGSVVGAYGTAGRITGGSALSTIPISQADANFPGWRTYSGTPKWVVVDLGLSKAYLVPTPTSDTSVEVTVSVIPNDLTSDSDKLFLGVAAMERYLGALLNFAAFYCLLRERYDGDAERFFQLATQELQAVGADPRSIPSFKEVANGTVASQQPA